ncbi:hypothetical protein K6Y31_20910 [Motilimonas cestriensis]|uniref:Uncharacterized protein n=1 Tax=Motilimonas cestriensis TaxID=2742685 RepID=A0ABS8WF98_9GAMM|nr:hypothetical protein [Motilimonas cestriensis]MCE2597238.1 hypothetical protein [Motilimonas cestriensis]
MAAFAAFSSYSHASQFENSPFHIPAKVKNDYCNPTFGCLGDGSYSDKIINYCESRYPGNSNYRFTMNLASETSTSKRFSLTCVYDYYTYNGTQLNTSYKSYGFVTFNLIDEGAFCENPEFPFITEDQKYCEIKICSDGFYGDPSLIAGVCDRPSPTPPPECGLTGLVMTTPPEWPSCNKPDDFPTPEPDTDKDCGLYTGVGWNTTYCIVNENDACVNGICRPGCGTIDGNFVCFGDDLDADGDGKMDDTNQLDGITDPNDMDKPSTANGCRAINGKSFCPQDPKDFIKPDGSFPSGCGFINDDFFCQPDGIANNPHKGLDAEYDNNPIFGEGDGLMNSLLTRLDSNQQIGFQNLGSKLVEQTQGLLQGMKSIEKTINDKPVAGVGTPSNPDDGSEPTPSQEPKPDYTLPTTGSADWFDNVLGTAQITDIQNKTAEKRTEIDTIITDFKSYLSLDVGTLSATYDQHSVQIKGVTMDLGAKAMNQFADLGVQHVIWLVVVLSGVSIVLVRSN